MRMPEREEAQLLDQILGDLADLMREKEVEDRCDEA